MRVARQSNKTAQYDTLPISLALMAALIAGAMFVFALAPYGVWGVAILSPLILYALLLGKISARRAFLTGLAYGTGLWATGAFWLYHSIHTYGNIPSWLALIMIGVMALVMGLFHAVMAWIFVKFLGRQPLAFAAIWVVQEWFKTWFLTGFPWLFVGYAFTDLPILTSFAPIGGVFLISFVAVLLSASLVELLRARAFYFVLSMLMLAVGAVLSFAAVAWTTPTGKSLSVSLVQGNIPQDLKWLTQYQQQTLEIYATLSQSEWGRDLVVWPEGAVPLFQDEAWPFLAQVATIARDSNTHFVTGIPYKDIGEQTGDGFPPFYNAALLLGANEGVYKKQRLVPFGEYIPLQGWLDVLPNLANSGLSHSEGRANQDSLMIANHPMGVAICYEVAYPDTTRLNAKNSEFLLTISNDAWFGTSAGPHQHLQMVQMRSLEMGRWFARGTNNGITAIIDDKGQIVQSIAQFEAGVLRGQVQMRTGLTPYARFGSYPTLALCALLLLLSVIATRQNKQLSKDYRFYDTVR